MAVYYKKRKKLSSNSHLNISKSGLSLNVGKKGANMTFGQRGAYLNLGIPGTGLHSRIRVSDKGNAGSTTLPEYSYSSSGGSGSVGRFFAWCGIGLCLWVGTTNLFWLDDYPSSVTMIVLGLAVFGFIMLASERLKEIKYYEPDRTLARLIWYAALIASIIWLTKTVPAYIVDKEAGFPKTETVISSMEEKDSKEAKQVTANDNAVSEDNNNSESMPDSVFYLTLSMACAVLSLFKVIYTEIRPVDFKRKPLTSLDITGKDTDIISNKDDMHPVDVGNILTGEEAYLLGDTRLEEVAKFVVLNQNASLPFVQQKMGLPYGRAAHIIDLLQRYSIVGRAFGDMPRTVYVKNMDELQDILQNAVNLERRHLDNQN